MVENASQSSASAQDLEWTGERFVPSLKGGIYYEHIHRYAFASQFCDGKACLDLASGEGFGTNVLAFKAARTWGVDIDEKSVLHANQKYGRDNLTFLAGSAASIPLEDKSVDVVTSFETIEHLPDHDKFMIEITRVLKVGGLLVISSPDKKEYSDKASYSNPYHQSELYHQDFHKLLKTYFSHVVIGKQRLAAGSYIVPDSNGEGKSARFGFFSGGLTGARFEDDMPAGLYSIAVCSGADIPEVRYGIFEDLTFLGGPEAINSKVALEQLQLQVADFQRQIAALEADRNYLDHVVKSAQKWQSHSWFTRAVRRWRMPKRK